MVWDVQKANSNARLVSRWTRWSLSVAAAMKIVMGRTTTSIWDHDGGSRGQEDAATFGWWSVVGGGG